jgi:pimeloyl-ACP methyl ester carboxylesterase
MFAKEYSPHKDNIHNVGNFQFHGTIYGDIISENLFLIFPGASSVSFDFECLQNEMLRHGYSSIVLDYRNCSVGNQKENRTFPSFLQETELLIKEILKVRNGKAISLLGHSFGGALAYCVASHLETNIINSLVFLDPTCYDWVVKAFENNKFRSVPFQLIGIFVKYLFPVIHFLTKVIFYFQHHSFIDIGFSSQTIHRMSSCKSQQYFWCSPLLPLPDDIDLKRVCRGFMEYWIQCRTNEPLECLVLRPQNSEKSLRSGQENMYIRGEFQDLSDVDHTTIVFKNVSSTFEKILDFIQY